jgi:hypothetical protein
MRVSHPTAFIHRYHDGPTRISIHKWPETRLSNLPELCSGGKAPPHPAGVEGGLSTGKHREERQDKQQNRLVVTLDIGNILETYAIMNILRKKCKDGDIKQWVPPCSIMPHWTSPIVFKRSRRASTTLKKWNFQKLPNKGGPKKRNTLGLSTKARRFQRQLGSFQMLCQSLER